MEKSAQMTETLIIVSINCMTLASRSQPRSPKLPSSFSLEPEALSMIHPANQRFADVYMMD